jgi:hypothetical protein
MKVKKRFLHDGVELQIIERDEPYMNGKEPLTMTRVMAPNGGTIPISINHRETLKSIAERTIALLDGFKQRGADVKTELTKKIEL